MQPARGNAAVPRGSVAERGKYRRLATHPDVRRPEGMGRTWRSRRGPEDNYSAYLTPAHPDRTPGGMAAAGLSLSSPEECERRLQG